MSIVLATLDLDQYTKWHRKFYGSEPEVTDQTIKVVKQSIFERLPYTNKKLNYYISFTLYSITPHLIPRKFVTINEDQQDV